MTVVCPPVVAAVSSVTIRRDACWMAGVACLLMAAVTLTPSTARAVSPASEALFQEGRQLLAGGRLTEACTRFTESYALEASSGTLLNLALCHEMLGRTATALGEYRRAERLARDQGRRDRATAAVQKITELELVVPELIFVAARPTPGLVVATDGGTVPETELSVPLPIDPGPHHVSATAPGRRPWQIALDIKERERRTLEIPELELAERVPAPAMILTAAPVASRAQRSRVDLVLAAGGGLLVVGGGVMFAVAITKFGSAEDACDRYPGCSQADHDRRISTVQSWERAAYGVWFAGGALLVSAAVHHYWWGRKSAMTVALSAPCSERVGLSLRGAF
jgi:hypothetical protein